MSVTPYFPPIADQMLALTSVARLAELADLPAFDAATLDLARAILDQSGVFCAEQLVPLNRVGDRVGARMQDGRVTLPSGFREAHRAWIDGGWGTLAADPEYGGQGLPFVLSVALLEQVASADMAFSLVSMLTSGAIEAIRTHGAYDLKRTFLPRLVSGEWTGTMSLTEPQAGSDVGAITNLRTISSIWSSLACPVRRREPRASAYSWCRKIWLERTGASAAATMWSA